MVPVSSLFFSFLDTLVFFMFSFDFCKDIDECYTGLWQSRNSNNTGKPCSTGSQCINNEGTKKKKKKMKKRAKKRKARKSNEKHEEESRRNKKNFSHFNNKGSFFCCDAGFVASLNGTFCEGNLN